MEGAECAALAHELTAAAGHAVGGTLSLSPPAAQASLRHPTRLGPAESNLHQVFTDGHFLFDPFYSEVPILRSAYEALIREMNGDTVEIVFFAARGLDWDLRCAIDLRPDGKRWTLMPTRLRECANAHGCRGALHAAAEIKQHDPQFGGRANAELRQLAAHVRFILKRRATKRAG
jgi:hypothetical protein